MATRNYYALLGISVTASTRDIQEAFRTLAKRLHPDLGGEQGAPDFREVLVLQRDLAFFTRGGPRW
jgi:DnaJ-class molecular chaperone